MKSVDSKSWLRVAAVLAVAAALYLAARSLPLFRGEPPSPSPVPAAASAAARPAEGAALEDELEEPGLMDEAGEAGEDAAERPGLLPALGSLSDHPAPDAAAGAAGANRYESLVPLIERALKLGRIPSLAIALVSGDRIVWSAARGYSNLRVKTEASPSTVYLVASTSKTMSTLGLLQQLDRGKFRLDDRVNDSLSEFQIQGENPRFPVTFRNLLTHTSGLPTGFGRHSIWEDPGPPALADFLRASLRLRRRPMSRVVYSNLAYALVGYLVERFSGVPFKQYMKDEVFQPIDMRDTAFEPRADMAERLAIPYIPTRRRGLFQPVDWVKADVWPAGIVYSTAQDMGRWLIANLNRGVYRDRRLIADETWREMTTRQFDRFAGPMHGGWLNRTTGFGLTWWVSEQDGEKIIAHSGSVMGYTAFMAGNVNRRTGVAILTNGNRAHRRLYELALAALAVLSKS